MVRRTKEDAGKTRDQLLDAAEKLFQSKGVSRTSLQDIAVEAGTTRGAVYWHFRDKADLFNAMMERVTLPLEAAKARLADDQPGGHDALDLMRRSVMTALHRTVHDERTHRVFEIATLQVEYNDEMLAVRERQEAMCTGFVAKASEAIAEASSKRNVPLSIPVDVAGRGLHALINGLFQSWLLRPASFDLELVGQLAVDTYLIGLGFKLTPLAMTPSVTDSPSPG